MKQNEMLEFILNTVVCIPYKNWIIEENATTNYQTELAGCKIKLELSHSGQGPYLTINDIDIPDQKNLIFKLRNGLVDFTKSINKKTNTFGIIDILNAFKSLPAS